MIRVLLALLLLSGCTSGYDPSRDPTHIERCETGEETMFCG